MIYSQFAFVGRFYFDNEHVKRTRDTIVFFFRAVCFRSRESATSRYYLNEIYSLSYRFRDSLK
jgi:hypothetical protein